ncbi:MAG: TolC family protein [Desulfobacterales bacterium]|jgi:outer membrane protein TolC|nr:TolC family protein [Desulfobacterales bacterium]
MNFRVKVLFLILALLIPLVTGGPVCSAVAGETTVSREIPRVLTLGEAVEYGLAHNQQIHAAEFALSGAEAGVKSVRSGFFPQIDASYGKRRLTNDSKAEYDLDYLDQSNETTAVRLTIPLFSGFYNLTAYQRARIGKELAEARLRLTQLQLVFDIQRRFLELIKARDDLRSAESAVTRLEEQRASAEAYCRVGMKPWLAVLQIKAELAAAEHAKIEAKNALRVAGVRLNSLLDLPAAAKVEYQGNYVAEVLFLSNSPEECGQIALTKRPDVAVAEKNVLLAEKDVALYRSRYYPKLSLDTDYIMNDIDYDEKNYTDTDRNYWNVGVNVQINLFAGGRDFFAIKEAHEAVYRARALARDLEHTIITEVTAGYMIFQDAGERIVSAKKALSAAIEAYDMASTRFRTDLGTNTELLDAQTLVTNAEVALTQSVVDQRTALAQLYYAMGIRQLTLDKVEF